MTCISAYPTPTTSWRPPKPRTPRRNSSGFWSLPSLRLADISHIPLIAQPLQPTGKVIVLLGGEGLVDAQLHHGDVSLREDVHEDRPCAVVQPPPLIQLNRGRG